MSSSPLLSTSLILVVVNNEQAGFQLIHASNKTRLTACTRRWRGTHFQQLQWPTRTRAAAMQEEPLYNVYLLDKKNFRATPPPLSHLSLMAL